MAFLEPAMDKLKKLEYRNESDVLHHLKGEIGYTYFGIYQTSHPEWSGWIQVYTEIKKQMYKLPVASRKLFTNDVLTGKVYTFYRKEYWDVMKLDFVHSQKIAEEIFIFAVNTNPKRAVKKAQKLVGVKVDGWIGAKTIKALNEFDINSFNIQFNLSEIAFYKYLAFSSKRRKHFRRFYKGWENRARYI